jgi:hypothetical protein
VLFAVVPAGKVEVVELQVDAEPSAAASITRMPSGMTSLPMPSPAITAMRFLLMRNSFCWMKRGRMKSMVEEGCDLGQQQLRRFFGNVVATGQAPAR